MSEIAQNSQPIQWAILLSAFLAATIFLMSLVHIERRARSRGKESAKYITVNASTNLYEKFRHYVRENTWILMPIGSGFYPFALSDDIRQLWETRIQGWLKEGVRITLFITSPNSESEKYWRDLVERFCSQNFEIYELLANEANISTAQVIAQIDRFHPTIALKGSEPLCMWIESDHPHDSRVAYGVEFVSPKDITGAQRERFDRYLGVFQFLLNPGPHLRRISAKGREFSKAA